MFSLFRKKIEFYSLVPGLEKISPVDVASSYRPLWTKKASQAYKQHSEQIPNRRVTTILKCPGVMQLFTLGYIVYNHCDISISGDGHRLKWDYLYEPSKEWGDRIDFNYVDCHESNLLSDYMDPPIGANKTLLKLNTPWRVKAPKDIIFLELPIFYGDEKRFVSAGGVLDPLQTNQINPAFWWYANDNTLQIIKAGTPLLQYIPIKRNLYNELIVREATDKEITKEKTFSMFNRLSFLTDVKRRDTISKNILK